MEIFDIKTCVKCGSTKFKNWKKLSKDEKSIATRFSVIESNNIQIQKEKEFCSRCYLPDLERELNA